MHRVETTRIPPLPRHYNNTGLEFFVLDSTLTLTSDLPLLPYSPPTPIVILGLTLPCLYSRVEGAVTKK
jgi:hypothetical protein